MPWSLSAPRADQAEAASPVATSCERQGSRWVVKAGSDAGGNPHGAMGTSPMGENPHGAMPPAGGPAAPGGALPPGHPSVPQK